MIGEVETQIFDAVRADSESLLDLAPGEWREVTKKNEATGHIDTKFLGNGVHFVQQFSRKPRFVKFLPWEDYIRMGLSN